MDKGKRQVQHATARSDSHNAAFSNQFAFTCLFFQGDADAQLAEYINVWSQKTAQFLFFVSIDKILESLTM